MKLSSLSNRSDSGIPAGRVPVLGQRLRQTSSSPFFFRVLITLLIFGLFMEWLLPLHRLGGDHSPKMLDTLLVMAVILLLQGLFTIRGWLWLPLNVFALLLLWGRLFDAENPFAWLINYFTQAFLNDVSALSERWLFNDLSSEARAFILLFGWSVMVSAVHTLVLYRGTVWLFGGTTIVYLTVMEVALENSLHDSMFRAVGYILISQGWMLLLKLRSGRNSNSDIHSKNSDINWKAMLSWAVSILILTAALTGIVRAGGEFVPPRESSELSISAMVDQIQEWTSGMSRQNSKSGASMTGYDSLGTEMGGPLTIGKGLVFTAETPVSTYWRGESVEYYDGRRWIPKGNTGQSVEVSEDLSGILGASSRQPEQRIQQSITLETSSTLGMPLFSGGKIIRIDEVDGLTGGRLDPVIYVNSESGNLRFKDDVLGVRGYKLEMELQVPDEKLKQRTFGSDPESIKSTYLQLPDSLPQRVRDLAKNITSGASGRYEKAEAVKSYLQREYTYTLNTKIPPAGRDFTDHFLFDSKEGYCTHFATSMVVLLRSQGIPARFVMGFAPGEKIKGTKQSYRVTQEEAHAWVEVYFPGEGWIAFDPTPGFSAGTIRISEQEALQASASSSSFQLLELMQKLRGKIQGWYTGRELIALTILILLLLPVLLLLGAGVAKRWSGRTVHENTTAKDITEREQLTLRSQRVWKRLEKKYGAIESGVTVKKYIQSLNISDDDTRAEIERFASRFEQVAYGKEPLSRTEKNLFLRQCRTIVKKRV